MKKQQLHYNILLILSLCCDIWAKPPLNLTLPSTTLKKNQQPSQLFGKPTETKTDHQGSLNIVNLSQHTEKFDITLTQAIAIALKNNTDIRTTYMSRILQRYQFYLDRKNRQLWNYFQNGPNITVNGGRNISNSSSKIDNTTIQSKTTDNSYSIAPSLGFTSPLGTSIQLSSQKTNSGGQSIEKSINLTQPLLKGFGYEINKINWEQSKLSEIQNILSLRQSVSQIILQVIQQYRSLIQASLTLQNDKQSLQDAINTLDNNQVQVKAGRLAESELLSSQIQVQSAKNQLLSSKTNIKQQQQDFSTLLGVNKHTVFIIKDELHIPDIVLNEKYLIDYALENQPNFLQDKLQQKSYELNLKKAKNDKLWDLSLQTSATNTNIKNNNANNKNYTANLQLSIPLDNSTQKQNILNAKISLENSRFNIQQKKIAIISDIRNKINTLQQTYKALLLQEEELNLQKQQVQNTEMKLKYGKSSAYDLAQQQKSLSSSRNQLISSKIDYLNQLSSLDDYLGTALATWQVILKP